MKHKLLCPFLSTDCKGNPDVKEMQPNGSDIHVPTSYIQTQIRSIHLAQTLTLPFF